MMQLGALNDLMIVWCFNVIIFGAAIWVALRVAEKTTDIALKVQGYQIRRRTDKWDREHERRADER